MTLHTVNKSPFSTRVLRECLDTLGRGHGVLMLEDGVYGALKQSPVADDIVQATETIQCRFFALQSDIQARGLDKQLLLPMVTTVDYLEFVDLTTQYPKVLSWF